MAAFSRLRLNDLPPIGAAALGAPVALAFAFMPAPWLDRIVGESGIAAILPVAEPPLGLTARALLALSGGTGVAAVTWAALFLLFGPGGFFARDAGVDGFPTVRRADAHPDAPVRKPLVAADLPPPTPAPAPPPVRELPRDLDRPLASYDPGAVPDQPREPVRPLAPLVTPPPARRATPLAPGERISSIDLSPARAAEPGQPSIEALLARLEEGARTQRLRRAV